MKVASQPAARENQRNERKEKGRATESSENKHCHSHSEEHGQHGKMMDTIKDLFSGIMEGLDHGDRQDRGHQFNEHSFDWLRDGFGGGFSQPESGRPGSASQQPEAGSTPGATPGSTGSAPSAAAGSIDPYKLAPHQKYGYDCGVTAARSALRAAGFDGDQDAILDDAIAKGYHTGRDNGAWTGPANMSKYLQSYGINSENEPFNQKNIEEQLQSGNPVIVSTDRHYFVISGKDENGNYIVGDTGTVVNKGTTISYDDLAAFSGGHTLVTIDAQNPPESTRPPASRL